MAGAKRKSSNSRKGSGPRKRNYKAEYARRVKSALAKGKTRQQARGHQAKEHVIRREREIEEGKVTWAQRKAIEKFHASFDPKGQKPSVSANTMIDWAGEVGYDKFVKYRKLWTALHNQYMDRGGQRSKYSERTREEIEYMFDDLDLPDDDPEWLFYH